MRETNLHHISKSDVSTRKKFKRSSHCFFRRHEQSTCLPLHTSLNIYLFYFRLMHCLVLLDTRQQYILLYKRVNV